MGSGEEMRAKQAAQGQASQEDQMQKMQEENGKRAELEERKRVMIRTLLEPDALERLNRIGLVKPERKMYLENAILQMANAGAIQEKMSEGALTQMAEAL